MNRDKLPQKENYSQEEIMEIVRETIFQISMELDDEYYELQERIDKENDSLLKAGLMRKKMQLDSDRHTVETYYSYTQNKFLTECCDVPVQYYAMNTRGQCSECGEDMPDTYETETVLSDLIEVLNEKIEEENNAE